MPYKGMNFRLALCLSALAGIISSCAPTGLDEWGHRPGPKGFRTVILDAGHGGKDPGAISRHTGQQEKDLALDMAKRIQSELGGNFRTILLRRDDTFIDLDQRVRLANRHGDAVLLSLHFNSSVSSIRGPETYFWRVDSHGLAVRCQRAMQSVCPVESGNRGLVRRRLRLTRNPQIPSVLLEFGYLSHPQESELCANSAYRHRMASAVASAIRDQSQHGDAGTGPLPRPIYAPPSRPTDAPE